jgi:hypothetical protein
MFSHRSFLSSAIAAVVVLALTAAAAAGVSPTRISTYHPTGLRGSTLHGSCWTSSNAVSRSDAYRCMVGNNIYDPCFRLGSNRVGCPSDLAANRGVFIDVPNFPSNPAQTPSAWAMELSNGLSCSVITGAGISGYPFGCGGSMTCSTPRRGSPRYTAMCGNANGGRVRSPRAYNVIQIWM